MKLESNICQSCNGKRDPSVFLLFDGHTKNKSKVHLMNIPEVGEKLKLFKANLLEEGIFEAVIDDCDGVFHVSRVMEWLYRFEDVPRIPKVNLSSQNFVESGFSFKFGIDEKYDDVVEYMKMNGLLA